MALFNQGSTVRWGGGIGWKSPYRSLFPPVFSAIWTWTLSWAASLKLCNCSWIFDTKPWQTIKEKLNGNHWLDLYRNKTHRIHGTGKFAYESTIKINLSCRIFDLSVPWIRHGKKNIGYDVALKKKDTHCATKKTRGPLLSIMLVG